ncbi:DUF2806 domain-containing protein [Hymenobacter ruricola]|uniref:DUF2806 domain-containing protein n=1 Tax=Hymenobacter ruricola TaxID=2791023 RepID=A0ABS0I2D9_9BACT|nr:DUF2806 domain-containing protein [Hymenobacter ruricola]MBF9221075.1 DUF2806 domain-containing protein [Hymenobacter ruricola]
MDKQGEKGFWELVKSMPIPDFIKNNVLTALSTGLGKIITSASDIPVAYFEQHSKIIRAEGDAKAKLITAAADSATKLFNTDSDLANRAFYHFGRKIVEQQFNREQVAVKMIGHLKDVEGNRIEDKKIDEDWLTQFWNLSETKSRDDVQEILSRILAKEVTNPGCISPYTLQLLSVLTSDIGNAFQRLSNLSIDDGTSCYIIHPNVFAFQNIGPLNDYDISYDDLFDLDGAGLIRSAETLMLNYSKRENDSIVFEQVNYAGLPLNIDLAGQQVRLIQFTKSGRELRNLLELTENKIYTEKIKSRLQDKFML